MDFARKQEMEETQVTANVGNWIKKNKLLKELSRSNSMCGGKQTVNILAQSWNKCVEER